MDDSPAVNVLERKTYLYKPLEDLRLAEKLIVLDLALDMVRNVANLAVFHDNDELL
jgi:hypothetical protein